MYWRTLFLSSYELILSVLSGLLSVYVVFQIVRSAVLKLDVEAELKAGRTAPAFLMGAVLLCVLLLQQASILPSAGALQTMVLEGDRITPAMVGISAAYFLAFYLLSLAFALGMILLAMWIYTLATRKIDEMAEIRANNMAVAVIVSLVLLGITLYIQPSVSRFFTSLVDYDALSAAAGAPVNAVAPPAPIRPSN